jgi:hypothetical protein
VGGANFSKQYSTSTVSFNVAETQLPQASQDTHTRLVADDLPETRTRRLLEVRLTLHYITQTSHTLGIDDTAHKLFIESVPKFALESDALLYSMYVMASLHLEKLGKDRELGDVDIRRKYCSMALREHREEVSRLNRANVDSACLTATMVRLCAFATLKERPRKPYTPPTEWLLLSGTTRAVFNEAWKLVGDDPKAMSTQFIKSATVVDAEQRIDSGNLRGLEHILQRDPEDQVAEAWDSEIRETYECALSIIGGILKMAENDALRENMMRRVILFPLLLSNRFVELVQEQQPRALVVLAHYFGILLRYRNAWYIGDSASEEIRAMASELTGKWLVMLEWPLQQCHQ